MAHLVKNLGGEKKLSKSVSGKFRIKKKLVAIKFEGRVRFGLNGPAIKKII